MRWWLSLLLWWVPQLVQYAGVIVAGRVGDFIATLVMMLLLLGVIWFIYAWPSEYQLY